MTDVNQAANKEWTLTTLNGNKILAKKPPTMKFANEQLLFSVVLTASREAMPWSTTASPLVR